MRRIGRRRSLLAAAVIASVAVAAVADAAVVRNTPLVGYQPNNTVRKIVIVGNTAYMAGQFTGMTPAGGGATVTRNHVAAVDMTTGALLPWNPNANGNVYALLASGGNIYIGGTFTTVGGATHKNLVEVNGTSGAPVAGFAKFASPEQSGARPGHLRQRSVRGRSFTSPRRYAAKVNAGTGALNTAWAPVISNSLGTSPEVRAIAVNASGTRVILGGFFNRLNSGAPGDPNATNLGVGAVDSTTGASLPWAWHTSDLQTFRQFQLLQFIQDGSMLFGAATGNGGSAMSWNIETGTLNYIEGFNGNVTGIGVADGVLYIGGHFTGYDGPIPGNNFLTLVATRDKLAAVDAATGQTLYSWNPSVNTNLGIEALATTSTRVAIGGEFTRIAGVNVAALRTIRPVNSASRS